METEVHVYLDVERQPALVGRLWARTRQGRETATFVYDPGWLRRRGAIALAPSLPLTPGPFHSDRGLFDAFSDAAPDRWGQKLMRHHERQRAAAAGTDARTLAGIDFLVGVDDETRLGALRFKPPGGAAFLTQTGRAVPPLVELGKLLSASDRIEKGRERKGDLALLLAPGGSLGGVRPKAVVRDRTGHLHLAKFRGRTTTGR
jgi:serine/threonine-protein kinase HipA